MLPEPEALEAALCSVCRANPCLSACPNAAPMESWGSENSVSCAPCAACNGTGVLQLAPVPPPLLPGEEGRQCSSCKQRWGRSACGHSMHDAYGGPDLWFCSPVCYVEATGDTRPWDAPRRPEVRVVILSLGR